MTDSLYRKVGDLSLPIADATVIPDPALTEMLALFAQAINSELAAAWTSAMTDTPMTGTTPVQATLPMAPDARTVREWKAGFPLLALSRVGEAEWSDFTIGKAQRVQRWELHYILAPLQTPHLHRFLGALAHVPVIVSQTIDIGGHPDYDSGTRQFDSFASLKLLNSTSGQASFAEDSDGALYAACTMTLEGVELADYVPGMFDSLIGTSFELGVGDATEILPSVIYAVTDP